MLKDIAILESELREAARLKFIKVAKTDVSGEKARDYENGTNSGNIATRKSAVERLKKLIGSVIKSKDNEEAKLSGNSVRKLVSETAVNKSIANGFTIIH